MSSTECGRDGYEISTDPARLDIAAMHAYLTRSYWSPGIPFAIVERAARNSLCFGLYEKAGGARSDSRAWSPTTPRSPTSAMSTCSRSIAAGDSASS